MTSAETLYIAPGPFGGDGSKENPLRVNSAAMFDAVLLQVDSDRKWKAIQLAEGVYETEGLWRFERGAPRIPIERRQHATFTRAMTIRGAGMDRTVIRLAATAVTTVNLKDRPDVCVMRFGIPWTNNGGPFLVEDLTVDGNQAAFPTNRYVSGGLVFHSNNVTCRRVKVIGLRGSFDLAIEAFGILVNNFQGGPYPGPDGNNHLIDCVLVSNGDTEEYVSPFYIGVRDWGRPMVQSTIVGCQTLGTGKKPTRLAVTLSPFTLIDRFKGDNIQHALYNDTGPVSDVIVRNSKFTRISYTGPWLSVDDTKKDILIENCEFEFTPKPEDNWIGVTIWDKKNTGAAVSNVVIKNCTFRGQSSGKPFTPYSVQAKVQNVRISGNKMPRTTVRHSPPAGVIFEQNPVFE